jgi:hypothetical protein
MPLELMAFALVGLSVGSAAALLLPRLFTASRTVTVLTGMGAALLTGTLGHAILGSGHIVATVPISALGAVLLVSLLARPDQRSQQVHRPHHA